MPTSASASVVVLTPTGGSSGSTSGSTNTATPRPVDLNPVQLLGLNPLMPCNESECRVFQGHCYINPVFAKVNTTAPTYENDIITFYLQDTLGRLNEFVLEKLNARLNVWEQSVIMSPGTTYGQYYPYGYFGTYPNPFVRYFGLTLNWSSVLTIKGAGLYRVKVRTPAVYLQRGGKSPYCLISEPFRLLPFDCNTANGTVKFEAIQTGRIGSISSQNIVFDICGKTFYDSVRVPGFFGYKKANYDEVLLEYQNGLIDRVRDETIVKYQFQSKLVPQYIHDRLMTYGLMANQVTVSDYNLNNSDYNIKQKMMVKDGGYEPVYNKGTRLSWVTVNFKDGIQSIVKSSSCDK